MPALMTDSDTFKTLLLALNAERTATTPCWLMRQAGRYLPEYRALRAAAGGFLELVFDPEAATEVTLQPIERFGFSAAILFSDILVVPHALGQRVRFETGEGPRLEPISDTSRLNFDEFDGILASILETVRLTRQRLKAFDDTALIGFAGAPWTLACYMAEGQGGGEFMAARRWAVNDPDGFQALITLLTDATIRYLRAQIDAGAEAVQLFDSWAGVISGAEFRSWVIAPAQAIAAALRASHPHIPLIGFPREAGVMLDAYAAESGVTALALDQRVSLDTARTLQTMRCVQGNLDPELLLIGGNAMRDSAEAILRALGQGPFVFNLGHGVIKETPVEHVAELAKIVRGWRV